MASLAVLDLRAVYRVTETKCGLFINAHDFGTLALAREWVAFKLRTTYWDNPRPCFSIRRVRV
jgi:hypothetical protein